MKSRLTIFLTFFAFGGCVSPPPKPVVDEDPIIRAAQLIFIGDVMSHTPQVAAAKTADGYDYSEVFRHFRPIFDGGDGDGDRDLNLDGSDGYPYGEDPETVAIANLETTLRTTPPYTGYPAFAAPAELAFAMRRAGIRIATTANNHICDKGARGIRSTLALLDSAGIVHTGAFLDSVDRRARNPLRFMAGGVRFALFTYTYGTNGLPVPRGMIVNLIDTAVIARDLAAVRGSGSDSTDCVIVSYHWGEEYRAAPTKAQRELAVWTRAHGADLIIGGHPHVVEPLEAYYNADSTVVTGATYYSLGNFVSNQRIRRTDGGIVADIIVTHPDSLPVRYDLRWRLAWVHTPFRDGIRRYEVLPAAALDTLPGPALSAARTFITDTRRLLSADSVFTEIR